MDQIKTAELLRPVSKSSRITDTSNTDTVETGADGTTGVILIGMETSDAATIDRTTIDSRRTSSTIDPLRPSDTNDASRNDSENHHTSNQNKPDFPPNPTSRRSNSSSTAAVLVDQRRSTSTISSESSVSQHQHSSSQESNRPQLKRTGRPRKTSSVDPPVTSPTTITSDSPSRPHSATEFQKFRAHLHSGPPNSAFHPENEEWRLHPNPHHPKTKTEVLRIERAYTPITLPTKTNVSNITNFDVLIPRFSPSYPPILREYGIDETEWSSFVHRVNRYCMEAFDPFRWSNLVVNIIAVLTCWLSEWIMPNITKRVSYILF
jgi:Golgin subfamily A member 7/ERF4 family